MLTVKDFITKFDNGTLKDKDIKRVPADFIDSDDATGGWILRDVINKYIVFHIKDRYFIKIVAENKIFELNYNSFFC